MSCHRVVWCVVLFSVDDQLVGHLASHIKRIFCSKPYSKRLGLNRPSQIMMIGRKTFYVLVKEIVVYCGLCSSVAKGSCAFVGQPG